MKIQSDGAIDSGFGIDGLVRLGGSGTEYMGSIGSLSDGSIFVTGSSSSSEIPGHLSGSDVLTAKLSSTGSLDSSFDGDGYIQIGGLSSSNDYGSGYIDMYGNYYVFGGIYADDINVPGDGNDVGTSNQTGFIVKMDSSGVYDTGFDVNGAYFRNDNSLGGYVYDLYADADGDILWCGDDDGTSDGDLVIGKMNANGTVNTGFGSSGKVVFADTGNSVFRQLAVDSDGSIYAAGYTDASVAGNPVYGSFDVLVVKLLPNGTLDNSFAEDGILCLGGSGSDAGGHIFISLSRERKIYLVTTTDSDDIPGTTNHGATDCLVIRLNPDGSLDESFDDDGMLCLGGSVFEQGRGVVSASNGRSYVMGSSSSNDIPGIQSHGFDDIFITVLHD